MKRGICLLVTLLFVSTFCGCNSNSFAVKVFTNLGIEKFEDENSAVLVKDYNDLLNYCDKIQIGQYDSSFKSTIMAYDEQFFEGKMLVLLYYWEETSSSKLSIKDVELKDNVINVSIKRDVPKIVSDTMKDYFFIIEVQRDANCSSVTYKIK